MGVEYYGVGIDKIDVLMEDFSNIQELIRSFTSDRKKLIAARNTWEVFFLEYDDDPREIPEIPEVVNWFEQSINAGIPWFYFMNANLPAMGLLTFMTCCTAYCDSEQYRRYIFDKDKTLSFVGKNLQNLEKFADENDIPDEITCAAADTIMGFVYNVLQGTMSFEEPPISIEKEKQVQEAYIRLSMLEKIYGLNPKVKKYFEDGRLYYSYITGGGYIGSIDTINYDERYAATVKTFEEQTSCLAYHVIERQNTIAVLFVGTDCNEWMEERPSRTGVIARIYDVDTGENEVGYIKIDNLNGALYRRDGTIYPSIPVDNKQISDMSDVDGEIVERLEILKNTGIITDLDITKVFTHEGTICCSVLKSVLGMPMGIINRITCNESYLKLFKFVSEQTEMKLYFCMNSADGKWAFLCLSENPADWEFEKLALEKKVPNAIVVDLQNTTITIEKIKYEIVNGGPIFLTT